MAAEVVGVHGVLQAEAVCPEAPAQHDDVGMKDGQRQRPGGEVQGEQEEIDQEDAALQAVWSGASQAGGQLLEHGGGRRGRCVIRKH